MISFRHESQRLPTLDSLRRSIANAMVRKICEESFLFPEDLEFVGFIVDHFYRRLHCCGTGPHGRPDRACRQRAAELAHLLRELRRMELQSIEPNCARKCEAACPGLGVSCRIFCEPVAQSGTPGGAAGRGRSALSRGHAK